VGNFLISRKRVFVGGVTSKYFVRLIARFWFKNYLPYKYQRLVSIPTRIDRPVVINLRAAQKFSRGSTKSTDNTK